MRNHIDSFINEQKDSGASASLVTNYRHCLYMMPIEITFKAMCAHIDALKGRYAQATIALHVAAIKRFLAWAYEQGIIDSPIGKRIKTTTPPHRTCPKGITRPQVEELIDACVYARDKALIGVMAYAGLRVSEALALRIKDIEGPCIHVYAGKGNKGRNVPISDALRALISPLVDERIAKGATPCSYLFVGRGRDVAMSPMAAHNALKAAVIRAGLPAHVSCHDLRHSFAGAYLKAHPGRLVNLATLMGHASIDTTAIYTRPSMDDLANEINAM